MRELKRETQATFSEIFWQTALNLMGDNSNKDPCVLKGEALPDPDVILNDHDNPVPRAIYNVQQSRLCSIFGKHDQGANQAIRVPPLSEESPGSSLIMGSLFTDAISLFAMARKTRKGKYSKPAEQIRSKIKTWSKKGNPNVLHYSELLDAEHKAFKGKLSIARNYYQSAITIAIRGGFIHDAALANERYAITALELNDEDEAIYRLKESIKLYKEWGAQKKVDCIRSEYPQFCLG